jgi:hypothetical protein
MQVRQFIIDKCRAALDEFMTALRAVLTRLVVRIVVRTAWGEEHDCASVASARQAIESLDTATPRGRFLRYELMVKYSNGDAIDASLRGRPRHDPVSVARRLNLPTATREPRSSSSAARPAASS